ncbi:Multifunctional tryptophan biosynthesis protein [Wickerhamiella sorbophila]|uniref:Multifunctional tryptophan biosynthesis protein n=1 Tax=Wickerhamiella sorbophila TaxID=45607 RepID=A0A2T0FI47_9ASCO|nr:Multifunctional tryptophan biosynthesis protein [Wickerhamiella sorbophila]PRT54673.1 Multifunctional tryptophan biosynthesis protein [Wickerhamiella sorbophila]
MPRVVLIDNYDSFTWNIYEYLCREGAEVEVHRNDKITIPEIDSLKPDLVMISPGPGHPDTDSGISKEVIQHYMGKIPVYGVCMGMQCMVSLFGGSIEYAGEIVHGKTSPITHDGKGSFKGVTQGVAITRYHSLAPSYSTLPSCLEVTCTSDSGVIQGVRHKEFLLEGVQFHPESIMSEEGTKMLRNFLKFKGGKWSEYEANLNLTPAAIVTGSGSILDQIYHQREKDVALESKIPGRTFADMEKSLALGIAPKLINVIERLRLSKLSLLAEIKRASPSKGPLGMDVHAATQALAYAKAGAAAISVLTEPHWFKGTIEDLRQVRLAVDRLLNRPAILRKEFVFSKYQILEARLFGADTVLLIVKMLNDAQLQELYDYSVSLGMEPLVEVANAPEMKRAVNLKAKFIGVNNRDLHTFSVDMNRTSSLVSEVAPGTYLAALSGITGRDQVDAYVKEGVEGVLVGESLMRATDPGKFVQELIA